MTVFFDMAARAALDHAVALRGGGPTGAAPVDVAPGLCSSDGLSSFEPESTRRMLPDSQEGMTGGRSSSSLSGRESRRP